MAYEIVLASNNAGKLAEIQAIVQPLGINLSLQKRYFSEEAVEDGNSYVENALIKARFASKKTGKPAIADDSGLEVVALNNAPGIYSARYSEGFQGKPASDELNNAKLLAELSELKNADRTACYYCAMVYVANPNDPFPRVGLGKWCGEVLESPKGDGGFGYDPLMWFAEQNATAAEMDSVLKNKISHRAQALNALVAQF